MAMSSATRIVLVGMFLYSPCAFRVRARRARSAAVKMDTKRESESAINETALNASGTPRDHPYDGGILGGKLGGGSFGKVYAISFPDDPGWVGAMKHIDMQVAVQKGVSRDDIAREFEMQHHVGKHVGLSADVLSWGVGSNRDAYAIVELMEGGNLQEYVIHVWGGSGEGMGKQADELARLIFAQIVYATMSMHMAYVVHLDYKPQNIMINNYKCSAKYHPEEPSRLFVFRDFSKPKLAAYEKKLKEQNQRLSPWQLEQQLGEKEAKLVGEFQKYWKPYVTTPEEWEREGCAIKVIDFGLSCITSPKSTGCAHHTAGQGTPAIMSKEQFLAAQAGHKANQNMDIWALGLTLYWLLFGTIPHLDSYGRLDRDKVVRDDFDVFQSAPWYWILYKTMNPHWTAAAAVLKVTMTSVRLRYTAKQIWDDMEYIAEYKRMAMAADQREKVSPRRNLPPSAGGVVEAEGNRKATAMDGVWEFFRIHWGSLWSKLRS